MTSEVEEDVADADCSSVSSWKEDAETLITNVLTVVGHFDKFVEKNDLRSRLIIYVLLEFEFLPLYSLLNVLVDDAMDVVAGFLILSLKAKQWLKFP